MGLIDLRSKFRDSSKHTWWGILLILGLALMLPLFFSGFGSGGGKLPADEQRRQQALQDRDQTVATVGDQKITRGELDDAFQRASNGENVSPLQRHQYSLQLLQGLENQAIMVQAAKKQGVTVSNSDIDAEIDKTVKAQATQAGVYQIANKDQQKQYEDEIRSQVEAQRDQIANGLVTQKLVDKLRKNVSLNTPGIKPSDIEVNARHILIAYKGAQRADPKVTRTKEQAKALAEKLYQQAKANPGGFADLANKNTDDPSGKTSGGDLGWFTNDRMVPAFSKAAFAAKPGDVVGPVETPFGFHVIKVEDRRVADRRSNEEVQKFLDAEKAKIKPVLVASDLKAMQAYNDYMTSSMSKDKKDAPAKRQAAITAYQTAVKERPQDAALYMQLGSLYKDAGDTQKAIDQYQAAAKLTQTADVHMALADLYRKQGKKPQAVDEYRIAARLAGNDQMVHTQLLMAFHDLGQKDLAKQQQIWLRNAQAPATGQPMTIPGG